MISLTSMLLLSALGPAEPRSESNALTAQKLAAFVEVSGEPVTALESAATLSVGAMWIDDANSMELYRALHVRASKSGKLPLRARFDDLGAGAQLYWDAARGRAYLVDCLIEGKGKFYVSASIGDSGAIDHEEKTSTRRVKDGHLTIVIGRQSKPAKVGILLQSTKPWTLTRCEITPGT